jgi:hypothetical protein
MGRRVRLAQPGAAVNAPRAVVESGNPADWTPHVLDGKVAAIGQVGNEIAAGGQFTQVASAAAPTTAIARSNILALRPSGRGAARGPPDGAARLRHHHRRRLERPPRRLRRRPQRPRRRRPVLAVQGRWCSTSPA